MTTPVFPASTPDATAEKAGKKAFPAWARYIFGKNKGDRKFAMMFREASCGAGRNADAS
jgi:hypothetical protein